MKIRYELTARLKGGKVITIKPMLKCNYRCEYCILKLNPTWKSNVILTADQWLAIVENEKPAIVNISGGEPLLYPHLRELIIKLIERKYLVSLVTNLSKYVNLPVNWRFIIRPSYHPSQVSYNKFSKMCLKYRKAGHKLFIYQVGKKSIKGVKVQKMIYEKNELGKWTAYDSTGKKFNNCALL